MRLLLLSLAVPFLHFSSLSQTLDSLPKKDNLLYVPKPAQDSIELKQATHSFPIKSIILPAALISYGFVALETKQMRGWDVGIKNEIREDNPTFHTPVDNYLQYAPAAAVYGLNAAGIHGLNNFRDRTIIYLMANAMMSISVESLKKITKVPRPDGGGTNAFPSGHTATAFVSAEFLRMEYKDISPWYGIGGYAAATATGILRMYNNKHWFRDILPGAGFGILSTRVSYWMYPAIKNHLFRDKPNAPMIMPYAEPHGGGLAMVYQFKNKV